MTSRFPWYDSWWLSSYVAARDLVSSRHPRRAAEFEAAFEPFRTDPAFRTLELVDIFSAGVLADARGIIGGLVKGELEKHEFFTFGRHVVHNHTFLNRLQVDLTELVSRQVGERVEPSYNFLSLYNNLGICELHLDAPNAKWTLDVCIEQSTKWPIHISNVRPWPEDMVSSSDWAGSVLSDPEVVFQEHVHTEGSALLFSGSSQWHYRKRISTGGQRNFSHLAFFHFVPAGMRALGDPRQWARIFGVPDIAEVISAPRGEKQNMTAPVSWTAGAV